MKTSPLNTLKAGLVAAFVAIGALAASVQPGTAAAFFGWQVTGVAANDVLNVRAYPASTSRILVGYPNGAPLSLVGRCTDGVDLNDINGLPAWQQRQIVRFVWCAVWLDPTGTGNFQEGWVYGRYIRPL